MGRAGSRSTADLGNLGLLFIAPVVAGAGLIAGLFAGATLTPVGLALKLGGASLLAIIPAFKLYVLVNLRGIGE